MPSDVRGVPASSAPAFTLDVDALLNEARAAFRALLLEIPDPEMLLAADIGHGASASAGSGPMGSSGSMQALFGHSDFSNSLLSACGGGDGEGHHLLAESGSPLFSAIMRARLVGHLVGCYEATASELLPEEAALWDVFVLADVGLRGSLKVPSDGASKVLQELPISEERKPACMDELRLRAQEAEGEVDFVDILDILMDERAESSRQWSLRASFQSNIVGGLSSLLGAGNEPPQGPSRRRTVAELRIRCARLQSARLAAAAAAYQRSMVLTNSYTCERSLKTVLSACRYESGASGDAGQPASRSRGLVKPLLAVLRSIHSELTPTERVLWELLGASDGNFDGKLEQEEFNLAMEELTRHSAEHEATNASSDGEASAELEELQRLRSDCQRTSAVALFASLPAAPGASSNSVPGSRSVSLADVLRWWWDMPEEYRIAAGFTVPAWLMKRSVTRQPEEMFRKQLRKVSADADAAWTALQGHVRVFAELRSLAVRRSVEALHSRTPTETQVSTTTMSEARSEIGVDAYSNPECECLVTDGIHAGASAGPVVTGAAATESVGHEAAAGSEARSPPRVPPLKLGES